jgi:hypothetical protein
MKLCYHHQCYEGNVLILGLIVKGVNKNYSVTHNSVRKRERKLKSPDFTTFCGGKPVFVYECRGHLAAGSDVDDEDRDNKRI